LQEVPLDRANHEEEARRYPAFIRKYGHRSKSELMISFRIASDI
jgi:hypothetical protein